MLLDLFGLEYGQDIPVFIKPGTYHGRREPPEQKPDANEFQDLVVLVGQRAEIGVTRESPRHVQHQVTLAARAVDIEVLDAARPAARYLDQGRLLAGEPILAAERAIIEGAVAIRAADDDFLLGEQ